MCNLAVRRSVFDKIGSLSTDLYPNEENEWLDRAHVAGVKAFYDPNLQIFRPQRKTPGEMIITLLRYGMGRTRQFQVSGWRPTFHQFLPVMLLATLVALVHWRLERDFVVLWLIASAIIAFTSDALVKPWQRIVAGLVAPLIPLTYAVGQIFGWIALLFSIRERSSVIVLFNEVGERI
jgi:GT2 family glycosyltransferase